jgi:hypothetical protein
MSCDLRRFVQPENGRYHCALGRSKAHHRIRAPTSRSTRVVRKSPPSGGYEAVADRALVILERSNLPANLGMTIDGSGAVVSNDFASAQAFAAPRPGSGPRPRNVGAVDHWRERGQARHVSRAPINEKRSGHAEKIIYVLVGRVRWPNLYRRRWCPLGMQPV